MSTGSRRRSDDIFKYVVLNADWTPSYDIRVDTQSKEKNITIVYKAAIAQNTGESWDGVPLTLETATPTFGVSAPKLWPWNLTISTPMPTVAISHPSAQQPVIIMQPRERSRSRSSRAMQHQMSPYRIKAASRLRSASRYINVPSDARKHNVAIAKLELMHLYCGIPSEADARAKIKNESEYTFIPGSASVYLDGSFVATTSIPSVSPQEVFDCPLGLDPSIRVAYHPREKKAAQSGFYTKTRNESFTQRITLFNTNPAPLQPQNHRRLPVRRTSASRLSAQPALTLTQPNNSSFLFHPQE
ncbi:hypothetical protein BDZ97DRAFT_1924037 [Flammula alnicola]|nr:hypothetical protein BDZ97DRAFT_1924037 [Flammula alnicola]